MTEKKNKNTAAHIQGNNRYSQKHYDRISLLVKKGMKDEIKAAADSHHESVNQYISNAVRQRLDSEKESQ